jgi:hypothetical protein
MRPSISLSDSPTSSWLRSAAESEQPPPVVDEALEGPALPPSFFGLLGGLLPEKRIVTVSSIDFPSQALPRESESGHEPLGLLALPVVRQTFPVVPARPPWLERERNLVLVLEMPAPDRPGMDAEVRCERGRDRKRKRLFESAADRRVGVETRKEGRRTLVADEAFKDDVAVDLARAVRAWVLSVRRDNDGARRA